jgi:hypothetical protein
MGRRKEKRRGKIRREEIVRSHRKESVGKRKSI